MAHESYEQAYNIFDHENLGERRPLSVVALHPKENAFAFGPIMRIFHRYRDLRIGERWKLSITEFLDLPREYVELIIKLSEDTIKDEQPVIDKALREAGLIGK